LENEDNHREGYTARDIHSRSNLRQIILTYLLVEVAEVSTQETFCTRLLPAALVLHSIYFDF